MVVLVADFASRLDSLRPRDNQRIASAPGIVRIPLEHLVGRGEPDRPTCRIMVVGVGSAENVEVLQVFRQLVGIAIEELVLVDRTIRTSFTRCAVVRAIKYNG